MSARALPRVPAKMPFLCSRRRWLVLAACAALPSRVSADDEAHPHEPDANEIALGSLADAELAFAGMARERGWHAALVAYLAPEGVVLEGSALHAADLRRDGDAPPLRHDARPGQVTVSRARDLGCVVGTYAASSANDAEVLHGLYLRTWRSNRGSWRIALTATVRTPGPVDFVALGPALRPGYRHRSTPQVERGRLLRLEANLRRGAATQGLAAPAMRTYRDGVMPRVGAQAVGGHAAAPAFVQVAQSADVAALGGAIDTERTGWYVHVWLRDAAGRWQLAHDLETPARRDPE